VSGEPRPIAELPTSAPRFVGRDVPRVEDRTLLTGRAEFVDDLALPGMLHGAILRSPWPHARILSVDVRPALELAGVAAAVTGEDARRWTQPMAGIPDGWTSRVLAEEKTRFVGEPVAAVAAASRALAEDALERIEVRYEPLPAVVDPAAALAPGSPLVFEERGTNAMLQRSFAWGDVDGAFRDARATVSDRFRWHRMGANPLETFGVIATWDPAEGTVTCRGSFQSPFHMGLGVSAVLGLAPSKVRIVAQPHGGSFGGKGGGRGTNIAALLSRRSGGRPVKWIEDRSEYLLAGGGQAWDRRYEASLALTREGVATGLRVALVEDLGATGEGYGALSAAKPLASFTGCYAIPAAAYHLTLVATNKLPSSPYRGMGPPPHNWVLEHLMDLAARELGLAPDEIRARNFIPKDRFPYTIASGNEYDSGDYGACLEKVREMADYPKLRREQEDARAAGRLLGVGLVSTIEPGVFDWNAYAVVGAPAIGVPEAATVAIDLAGQVVVRVGFAWEGQGQYTLIAQLMADYFGVGLEGVRVIGQDSLSAPPHFGPGGSRLGVAITGAVLGAADRLRAKLERVAARLLGAEPEAVELFDGRLRLRGAEVSLSLAEVAGAMLMRSDLLPPGVDPRPEATHAWTAPGRTVADEQGRAKSYLTAANACHLVSVEVDPATGQVRILRYWIADDCGTRLNPATVEGMIQGGVAQGVGAALLEQYVYDEGGQPLTATLMDYLLPTLHEVPETEKAALVTPSPFTPLGAKGVGEGAIHTTPAAVLCAINDALAPLGARVTEVPATPERVWRALRAARGDAAGGRGGRA
jgi:CO/xanthine dehydrogenase Mo-binding subunit